jgi:uncharacterized protein (DUF2062 family)
MIRYFWAAPNTVIGLLFVPIVVLTKGGLQIVDGVMELHCSLIAVMLTYCVPLPGGACAITFGHVVLGRDEQSLAQTRQHERVHVRQYELWGPAFIPAYVLAALWGLITRSGIYHGNFFERQAMQRESQGNTQR